MNVLIACEESQAVCKAFREKGHRAFSCDIQECSGGHPEWHIVGDVLPLLNGRCEFTLQDRQTDRQTDRWDLIIAHPPCTYLTNCATRSFSLRCTSAEKVIARWEQRAIAAVFFMRFVGADCDRIAIENPVGFMTKAYRKPDQYINPWMWAEDENDSENYHSKKTGLWLKGLPLLKGNGKFDSFDCSIYGQYSSGKNKTWEDMGHGSKNRSKTFPGIAKAMADQWGQIGGDMYDKP